MCTGDNIDTASAISREAGILKTTHASEYAAMVGADFRKVVGTEVTDPKTKKKEKQVNVQRFRKLNLARDLSVLARSSPLDKYLLVSGIQACGGVVAVTGDGTNDAPALKQADVGFAMGQTGTDVAKGASDIILLDDNFASITVALQFGRNVYDNVRKFLQFQLTVNVVAMFIVFFGSVILKDSPLTAVQMLWVNMIMDTFAALALATEPPDEDILDRAPYHKDAPIVTDVMWRNVHGHAIYQIIVICVVIFVGQGLLCENNYDNECSEWDTLSGRWELDDAGMRPWCLKFNPFYSMNHYYEGQTKHYWDGRVLDCEAAAQFNYPNTASEAYGGGDSPYADGEKRGAARDKCDEMKA
jgi:magnesium-transporting ATPase (P-type)